jgi:hypothetical protein
VLTVRRCRELFGPKCTKTDLEIEVLRDQLMVVADVALDAALDKKLNVVNEEERVQISERATIMEFDGQMERAEAEDLALKMWLKGKLEQKQTPIN